MDRKRREEPEGAPGGQQLGLALLLFRRPPGLPSGSSLNSLSIHHTVLFSQPIWRLGKSMSTPIRP
jgi:hypothetical protein